MVRFWTVCFLLFLPGCLFFMVPAGAPKGYVFGRSQAEVYERIAKRASEECQVGDRVYVDIDTGTLGLFKGSFWCEKEK